MNYRKEVKNITKIINKYIDVLDTLVQGGNLNKQVANKLGISPEVKSLIEHAYKYGYIQADNKNNINESDIERLINRINTSEVGKLTAMQATEGIERLLTKQRDTISRQVMDKLKKEYMVLETVFKDEPIPHRWMEDLLRKVSQDAKQDWNMVVMTELKNSHNQGIAESIVNKTSAYSNKGLQTRMYKRPASNACEHCIRLHLEKDRVTPKVFTLEQLIQNGTNVGKKVGEWLPTVGVVHPRCQCELLILPDGAEFDERGQMKLKSYKEVKE